MAQTSLHRQDAVERRFDEYLEAIACVLGHADGRATLRNAFRSRTSRFIIDIGLPKKGKHSVGVARQYCGPLGKQDSGSKDRITASALSAGFQTHWRWRILSAACQRPLPP
jgi:SRSO17 transposase